MYKKRIAQTQIITIVLITGIILGTIGSTLYWGKPLIEKTSTTSEISSATTLIKQIQKAIDEVAQNKESRVLDLNLNGNIYIEGAIEDPTESNPLNKYKYRYNNEEDQENNPIFNTITYIVEVGQAVSTSNWIPLDGNPSIRINSTTLKEEFIPATTDDKSGVIMLKTEYSASLYNAIFKLAYRELVNLKNNKGYVTQLVNIGQNQIKTYKGTDTEPRKLIIRYKETISYPNEATTGDSLEVIFVEIGFE
jgi:hypothetical protein